MASKRITINANSVGGKQVALAVYYMQLANDLLVKTKTLANEVTGDGGVTTANLEGSPEFGIGTGQGATFYSDLTSLNAAFTPALLNIIADMIQQ